jgi:hypothetical protein
MDHATEPKERGPALERGRASRRRCPGDTQCSRCDNWCCVRAALRSVSPPTLQPPAGRARGDRRRDRGCARRHKPRCHERVASDEHIQHGQEHRDVRRISVRRVRPAADGKGPIAGQRSRAGRSDSAVSVPDSTIPQRTSCDRPAAVTLCGHDGQVLSHTGDTSNLNRITRPINHGNPFAYKSLLHRPTSAIGKH